MMLRPDLPPLPERMRHLPIDSRGFPIPFFVHIDEDGTPDFRVVGKGKIRTCVYEKRCWLCGDKLGRYMAFVIGSMCCINRISAEPPCHKECAVFSAQACPFLSRPHMRRRENALPPERVEAAGNGIDRNPGVVLVWITTGYRASNAQQGNPGVLFELGDPEEVLWFAEGRAATHDEVVASIDSGFPILLNEAKKQGPKAVEQLMDLANASMQYLPEKTLIEVATR